MDKKFLKEHNLLASQRKFQQLCEYTFISAPLAEDDDEEMPSQEGVPPQQGEQPQSPMDSNIPQDNMPQDDGQNDAPPIPDDSSQEMPSQPSIGGLGDTLPDNMPSDDETEEIDVEGDEEVIDVDDLTNSQEETEEKVDMLTQAMPQLLKKLDQFIDKIDQNDSKIEALSQEFQKRVPTETEKLNLRSQASYPYSIKPKDYWDDKATSSNYDVMYDNDVAPDEEEKEYTIKQSDLKGGNAKSISDTFDMKDRNMDLERIFGL